MLVDGGLECGKVSVQNQMGTNRLDLICREQVTSDGQSSRSLGLAPCTFSSVVRGGTPVFWGIPRFQPTPDGRRVVVLPADWHEGRVGTAESPSQLSLAPAPCPRSPARSRICAPRLCRPRFTPLVKQSGIVQPRDYGSSVRCHCCSIP